MESEKFLYFDVHFQRLCEFDQDYVLEEARISRLRDNLHGRFDEVFIKFNQDFEHFPIRSGFRFAKIQEINVQIVDLERPKQRYYGKDLPLSERYGNGIDFIKFTFNINPIEPQEKLYVNFHGVDIEASIAKHRRFAGIYSSFPININDEIFLLKPEDKKQEYLEDIILNEFLNGLLNLSEYIKGKKLYFNLNLLIEDIMDIMRSRYEKEKD